MFGDCRSGQNFDLLAGWPSKFAGLRAVHFLAGVAVIVVAGVAVNLVAGVAGLKTFKLDYFYV